jgi:threonine/homoserine/homoserine lactone efflux protein
MLWAFIPIAAIVTVTPGATTAMVVRSASSGGIGSGIRAIAGNELGVLTWAMLSVAGVSALIAASEIAFAGLKLVGAAVLIWLGAQSLRRARHGSETSELGQRRRRRRPFRDGLVTSLANPKLAVFFVALFPQFVGRRNDVFTTTLLMAALIVVFDFAWYSVLSVAVSRAKRAVGRTRLARRLEALSGTVLIGLGLRVALEQR